MFKDRPSQNGGILGYSCGMWVGRGGRDGNNYIEPKLHPFCFAFWKGNRQELGHHWELLKF